ncbi:MAG TPA: ABC transporter permease, partial [Anaerolineae bacterium]|nr:ABC transporter permease [Anaerolineae bacterium]
MRPVVSGRFHRFFYDHLLNYLLPLAAVLAALVVGGLILWLQGVSPLEAYKAMFLGALGSKNGIADTLVKATPLMLVGLGIAIAFRGGVINIGAEGQLIMGALLVTYLGVTFGERLPGGLGILLLLLAGAFMGGAWGAIPGWLKARLDVNEILSTIMMNAIAIQIGYYLLRGPMIDPAELAAGTNIPHSARLPKNLDMARFTDVAKALGFTKRARELGLEGYTAQLYGVLAEPTRLHVGLLFAILMAVLVYIFLWRTTIGYKIRAVGLNRHAARYAGIPVERTMVLSMTLSGAYKPPTSGLAIRSPRLESPSDRS